MCTISVSAIQFEIPQALAGITTPTDPNPPQCGCGCGCNSCNTLTPLAPKASPNSVRYGTGEVILEATDLETEGFGVHWGHSRSFASGLSQDTNAGNGTNWQIAEWPYLVFPSDTTVAVMGRANGVLWFDQVGTTYVPRFSVRQTLLLRPLNNVYQLIDLDGSITQFNASTGVFQSRTDPACSLHRNPCHFFGLIR